MKIRDWTHGSASQCKKALSCLAAWHWNKIIGVDDPMGPGAKNGVIKHDKMDGYMKGKIECPQDPTIQVLLEWLPEPHEVDNQDSEFAFKLVLPGAPVPMVGFIDLREQARRLITDYKFRGDFRYVVEPDALRKDIQALVYPMVGLKIDQTGDTTVRDKPAQTVLGVQPVEPISFRHLSSRTKGRPKVHESLVTFTPRELHDEGVPFIVETLEMMKEWSTERDPSRVPYNTDQCEAYGGCAFKGRCTKLGRLDYSRNLFGGMGSMDLKSKLKGGLKPKPKVGEEEPGMVKRTKKTPGFASMLGKKPGTPGTKTKAPVAKTKALVAKTKAPVAKTKAPVEAITEGWFTFTSSSKNAQSGGILRVSESSIHVQYEDETTASHAGGVYLQDGVLRCGLVKFHGVVPHKASAEDAVNPETKDPEQEEEHYDFDLDRLPFDFDKYKMGKPLSAMTMGILASLHEALLAEAEGDSRFMIVYGAATEGLSEKPSKEELVKDTCLLVSIREAAGADLLMEFAKQKNLLDDGSDEETDEEEEHPMVGVSVALQEQVYQDGAGVFLDIVGVEESVDGLVFTLDNDVSCYEREVMTRDEVAAFIQAAKETAQAEKKKKTLTPKAKKTATQLGLPKAKPKTPAKKPAAKPPAETPAPEEKTITLLVLVGCVALGLDCQTAFNLIEPWEGTFQEENGMPTFAAPYNEGTRFVAGKFLEWCIENGFDAFVEAHGNMVQVPRHGTLTECLLHAFENLRANYGWKVTFVVPGA